MEGILPHFFYTKSRQDVPPRVWGDHPWPLQGTQTLANFFPERVGSTILASPHDNLGGLSKDGEGSLALSHKWRGFLKRQWAPAPQKMKWYEDGYGIKLLPKKDRASLSLAPSRRKIEEHARRNAKGCVHSRNMGGIDSGG